MSDTERVFALYVQVNPVPEPNLLPPTRDVAQLPIIEGSTIMDTRERIEVRPPERVRRWKPAVVVAAAFVLVLGIVGGVLLLSGDEDGGPVAAADAHPMVTCDGESCTYDGPTRITRVGHIRHKETDRIAALATELRNWLQSGGDYPIDEQKDYVDMMIAEVFLDEEPDAEPEEVEASNEEAPDDDASDDDSQDSDK